MTVSLLHNKVAVKAIVTLTTLIYFFTSRDNVHIPNWTLVQPTKKLTHHQCTTLEASDFPHLCSLFASINLHPEKTVKELHEFAKLVGVTIEQKRIFLDQKEGKNKLERNLIKNRYLSQESQLPSVLAHGKIHYSSF